MRASWQSYLVGGALIACVVGAFAASAWLMFMPARGAATPSPCQCQCDDDRAADIQRALEPALRQATGL